MTSLKSSVFNSFLTATACLALAGCDRGGESEAAAVSNNEAAPSDASDPVASAMSAAPESISRDATIMQAKADGSMATLREGKNGWTCMPDSPATPGPDPMCMDAAAFRWAGAWIGHKTPPADAVGVMYMLSGGTDASNTDPYAQKPGEGGDWVKTGPHIMIVGSKELLKGHPTGARPDTKAPYVMWSGTPYAHLMVPVG